MYILGAAHLGSGVKATDAGFSNIRVTPLVVWQLAAELNFSFTCAFSQL